MKMWERLGQIESKLNALRKKMHALSAMDPNFEEDLHNIILMVADAQRACIGVVAGRPK